MSIPYALPEKQTHALIESTGTPNQTALAVCNPDGSDIGGGMGGGGDVNLIEVGGSPIALGQAPAADSIPVVLPADQIAAIGSAATEMQSLGSDATGQDAYATIKTPTADASHILISLKGNNDAVVSLDNGVTDHIFVPGGAIIALDNVSITSGVAIQAKNATGGSNYTSLSISIW